MSLVISPPVIAILRGLAPPEALDIAAALFDAGVRWLEVPLNSPQPLESMALIRKAYDGRMEIGAGTVLEPADVVAVAGAGGQFIVSPNTDAAVIGATKHLGLVSIPGFFTASEGFAAIAAGADALKLFPADAAGPAYVKALKAVLPPAIPLLAVGGVDESKIAPYFAAGAGGFGLGSTLYRAGDKAADVNARARRFVTACAAARP